ncbi:MAG: hypothetical protein QXP59_02980 [Saccharolobus sp.]
MVVWNQLVDYRELEGIERMLTKYKLIPYFGDYTTLWNGIHKIKPEIIIPENKEFVESDGTSLKISNAGEYRQFKYGDLNVKREYLIVIITPDVKKKKLLYLDHIQGKGQSEPKVAEKQIKEDSKKYKIKNFMEILHMIQIICLTYFNQ